MLDYGNKLFLISSCFFLHKINISFFFVFLSKEEIIIHIMNKELRNYYKLEKKWGDKDNVINSN